MAVLLVAPAVRFIIARIDRSALSLATPDVRKEFAPSLGAMGVLVSVFPGSYGVAQLLSKSFVDRAIFNA